ncbi:restriction endonuclease subunit S [Aeromonas enteropelogenes]|uniref:restriction endonuclease subunit S n=1 Tax=Aeromonas enteropelogenes TaxID=29489 RepID=UPI003F74613B
MENRWVNTTLGGIALGSDGAVDGPFGSNLPASAYTESGYPIIRGSNLSIGLDDFKDHEFVYVPENVFQRLSRSECIAGDIIFTKKGTLGQTGLLCTHHRFERYLLSSNQMRLRVDTSKALPEYVYYWVSSQSAINKLIKDSECTGVPKINLAYLKSFPISLPNLDAQKKIVNVLGALNKKITLNRQINQTLEQMAQTLFKSWFVDFDPVIDNALDAGFFEQDLAFSDELLRRAEARRTMREHGDSKPLPDAIRQLFPTAFEECAEPSIGLGGWVPKGWKYESFGQLLSMSIGGDWGKDSPDESHSVQSRIVRGTDIPDLMSGQLSKAPLRWVEPKKLKSRQIEAGDIIIEVSGGSPTQSTGRSIFMSDLMLQRLGEVVEPASFCRRFKPKSINHGLLGFLHLQKIYADGKMWEYQNQSTGIANFQTKFFLEAEPVLIPSNDLLDEFCKRVKPLVDKSHSNEQIVLTNLRDTLLPKLISGELRLDNIEADFAKEGVA